MGKPAVSGRFLVIAAAGMVGLAVCTPSSAEPSPVAIDKLFAQWSRSDSPGCSLGVSRNGTIVYERGYGVANLELGVPITPASVFHVASVSKQFTAMSILLLAQRGQLALDDEVRKHMPAFPEYGTPLTIRHLLTHTSGLRDAFLLIELAAPREDGASRSKKLLELLARQKELNSAPGAEYAYSNAGYLLLAAVVERVSGQSLRAFADTNIFKPLGMTQTHFHDDATMVVPHRASGYRRDGGGLHLAFHGDLGHVVGNTGLFTTARDLLRWEQNFADARVGDPALVAAMQEPTTLTGGETSPYGFGLQVGRYRGLRTIGHGGGDPGYAAYVVRYPDQGLALALLCNQEDIEVGELANRVADAFLAETLGVPSSSGAPSTPPRVSLSAEQLMSKEGLYYDSSSHALLRMVVAEGKLMGSPGVGIGGDWEVVPVSATRFLIPGTPIALEFPPAAGGPQEMHVIGEHPRPDVLRRVGASALSRKEAVEFAGAYASPELEVTYTVNVLVTMYSPHGGAYDLAIQIPGRAPIALLPVFRDGFAGSLVGVVKFSRDARGGVTGFTVNTNGVRGLRFDRVEGRQRP